MKDVHGAVFGESKNESSPKQLGLLALANASANNTQESVKKLASVAKAVNASKTETEELRREVGKLHAVREQAEEINTYAQSWLSEAFDHVIDEFWPHGAPTDESVNIIEAGRGGSGTGTG